MRDVAWLDGARVVTQGFDGSVRTFVVETGKDEELIASSPQARRTPTRLAVSPDRKLICQAGSAGIAVYRAEPFEKLLDLTPPDQRMIGSVAFDPSGKMVLLGTVGTAYALDAKSGELLHTVKTPNQLSVGVTVSPDHSLLAAAGARDGVVRVWSVKTGDLVKEWTGHEGEIRSAAFSPDGRWLLTGSDDCTVLRWDVTTVVPADAK